MSIFNVLTLIGGLAMFLYGMNVMGGGLEKLAGGKLEKIFEKLTSNPLKAVLLGLSVTAVIQSSSATTVMLVGFVNAGIMKLHSAIGVIMGANIGTTVTAWLLSLSGLDGDSFLIQMLKPTAFSPVLAIVGVAILTFSKSDRKKDVATILIGFAVLMFGMNTMSGAVEPLKDVPEFAEILLWFKNPILGVLAGALLTAIIQSSSASVGILQALSATGAITFGSALPIIFGQNIGTCVTALLSSIGTSKNAKRVAVAHLYFNIIGTVLFLTIFYIANALIGFSFIDGVVGAKEIAIVHTIFNLSTTIVLLPFIKVLEKLAYLTIKDGEGEGQNNDMEAQFRLLDDRFLQSPTFAVEKCRELTYKMGEIAKESINMSIDIATGKFDQAKADQIKANESAVDMYEDKLGTYLVKLSSQNMSVRDSQSVSTLLHVIGDFERISDHAMNIVSVAEEKHSKNVEFSAQATEEITVICNAVKEILDTALEAFEKHDLDTASRVEPLEEVVDRLRTRLKNRHVRRLQSGECTIEMGFIFSDLLTNLERVSDHCSNIAVCLIQADDESFDTHEYVKMLKNSGEGFDGQVKRYCEKYALPAKEL
ncbi:Na/Pi cotransporter family protein [Ruminococcus sp.]|uniref:Na/Pi cotransporter family protein n=1 Tax=Ruminococcus sp. TaxID=41978 RepID=UPI0026004FDD|nr:Na/Pi cotransporter family protein [Ruminococcus sp.]